MQCIPIHNYQHKYLVTDEGNVLSLVNNNVLKPRKNKNGYLIVTLEKEQLSIHRLVAKHFIVNPYELPQVNHKNGNKIDNRVGNLEWCTSEANAQHALETGLRSGFVSYPLKIALMHRVLAGELIADLAKELPATHPNTLSRMLRVTAEKEGYSNQWKIAMLERRRNVAIRNLEKINT